MPRPCLRHVLAASLLWLVACGGDASSSEAGSEGGGAPGGSGGSGGHAGAPGGAAGSASGGASAAGGSGAGGTMPGLPAMPVLTPCPAGWQEKKQPFGVSTCEPGPLPSWICPPGWDTVPWLAGTLRAYSICKPPQPPDTCPE